MPLLSTDAFSRVLTVVDSHTCGQPTRVVVEGHGLEPGTPPQQSRAILRAERDWVRSVSVTEPRGHRSMFSVALIHPAKPGEAFGVVFMDAAAYPDMCGHATIGVATTLIETGLISLPTPDFCGIFQFGLQTPAGSVPIRARVKSGRCEAVSFRFEGARFFDTLELSLPDGSSVAVDIAYAGQWYAFLPASAIAMTVEVGGIGDLVAAARGIREALKQALAQNRGRWDGTVPDVGNIVWTDAPRHPEADHRNVPVSVSGSFDRSPCGTATCARMAVLIAKEQLDFGQAFVNEGLLGTIYRGHARRGGAAGTIDAEVEGTAWLTAFSTLVVQPDDPLGSGYLAG